MVVSSTYILHKLLAITLRIIAITITIMANNIIDYCNIINDCALKMGFLIHKIWQILKRFSGGILKVERKPLFSEEWVTFVVQKNLSKN